MTQVPARPEGWWQQLQAAGVDVVAAQHWGYTPLHAAAKHGLQEIVAQLLAGACAGACAVDAQDSMGATPLMKAACNGHSEVVQQLLHAGAAVNTARKDGLTSLHLAVWAGHAAVVQQLLSAGAGVLGPDSCTPLLIAALQSRCKDVHQWCSSCWMQELLLTKQTWRAR